MKEIIDLIDALELECKSGWKNEDCIIGVEQFAKVLRHRVGLVKNCLIADVVGSQTELVCDCQDYDNGFVSNCCPVHNVNPYTRD